MQKTIDIQDLERRLAPHSHSNVARRIVQDALDGLKTGARLDILNGSLLRAPIYHEDVKGLLTEEPEYFAVLQGDVISTDAAYVMGMRRTDNPSYVIATSTCDAVIGRQAMASLLEVVPVRCGSAPEARIKTELSLLTRYKRNDYFYLPRIPGDDQDIYFNVAHLDYTAQCANDALALATRRASMTLLGWRVLGSLLRDVTVREAKGEAEMRLIAPIKV